MSNALIEGLDAAIDDLLNGREMRCHCPFSSEEIRNYRKKRNISQDTLARELGVSVSTVQSWEMGRRKPTESTMKKIEKAIYA